MKEIKTEMKITAPEGMQIDQEAFENGEIKFKPITKQLPQSWEELGSVEGYYWDSISDISQVTMANAGRATNKNVFPTRELADAALALSQLLQLRDRYNDGWVADYTDTSESKYVISVCDSNLFVGCYHSIQSVMAFKTKELRDEFFKASKIRELLEIAKPLL